MKFQLSVIFKRTENQHLCCNGVPLTVSYRPFFKVPGSPFHRVMKMTIRTEDEVLEAVEISIDGEPADFILKLATFHIISQE